MFRRKNKQDVLAEERALLAAEDTATVKDEMKTKAAAGEYTRAALSFQSSEAAIIRKSARNARLLAGVFGGFAALALLSNMLLMPLKTVQPYLVRVDNNSGYTDVVAPLNATTDSSKAEDEYWLATYVRSRESYNWYSAKSMYSLIALMSYPTVWKPYREFQLSDKGYTSVMAQSGQIQTQINGVVFLKTPDSSGVHADNCCKTAQVRLTKTVLDRDGNPDPQHPPSVWLATVTFDYANPPPDRASQFLNPRGFGVRAYSLTQEVVGG